MFTLSTTKGKVLRRAYHHGNLRQALLDTSLEVISEQGVRALTLREISARLNVSRMAPYRHFADKSALLEAIAAAGFQKFGDALEAALRAVPEDFPSQSEALAIAYVEFAWNNRAHFEVMFGGGGEPQYLDAEGKAVAYRSFLILESMVRRGQLQRCVIPGDATRIAQMIWATIHGISTLQLGRDSAGEGKNWDFVLYSAKLLRSGIEAKKMPS